jgi:hypothetical protein
MENPIFFWKDCLFAEKAGGTAIALPVAASPYHRVNL